MAGSFLCPYCNTQNACSCETCKPHIKEGDYVNYWTEDGEGLICGKCNKTYSPDQSLEEEFKQKTQSKITAIESLEIAYRLNGTLFKYDFQKANEIHEQQFIYELTRAYKSGQSNAEMQEAGLERDEVDEYVRWRIINIKSKQNKSV